MKIKGFFKDDIGFMNVHLVSEQAGLDETIEFLVDTGSSRTVLLDKDALFLGIDYSKLKRFEQDLGGIGGSVETHVIEDSVLGFGSDEGMAEIELAVFVLKHPLEKIGRDEQIKILRIPSILGRDIITKFRLIFDREKAELSLLK